MSHKPSHEKFSSLHDYPSNSSPSPSGRQIGKYIVTLLELFTDHVSDQESHDHVLKIAKNQEKWSAGHQHFDVVRRRFLKAEAENDRLKSAQYFFEESCLETIYNESHPAAPFDSVAPFWIPVSAIRLANELGMPLENIISVFLQTE